MPPAQRALPRIRQKDPEVSIHDIVTMHDMMKEAKFADSTIGVVLIGAVNGQVVPPSTVSEETANEKSQS